MKKLSTTFALAIIISCWCLPASAAAPIDEAAVLAAVRANMAALEDEDLDGYLATIHEDAPGFGSTRKIVAQLFEDYDLAYELEKLELVEDEGDEAPAPGEAKVSFVQVTRKIKGGEFRDNRVTGVHTLKTSDGAWKLLATEVQNIEYLP